MNQSINTDSKNSKEPQQKYRLGTVSIKILGGLNRFYRRLTSPSASIMAQNIQLYPALISYSFRKTNSSAENLKCLGVSSNEATNPSKSSRDPNPRLWAMNQNNPFIVKNQAWASNSPAIPRCLLWKN